MVRAAEPTFTSFSGAVTLLACVHGEPGHAWALGRLPSPEAGADRLAHARACLDEGATLLERFPGPRTVPVVSGSADRFVQAD